MVKNPNMVERNSEICCCEMTKNPHMNFFHLFMAEEKFEIYFLKCIKISIKCIKCIKYQFSCSFMIWEKL